MHRPPAVSHSAARSLWHGCLLLVVWLTALGPVIYFAIAQSFSLASAMMAVIWLLCGWVSLHAWRTSATGFLQWDGEQWHWIQCGEGRTCQVRMAWDLQQCVLVHLTTSEAKGSWLWLESGTSTSQWNALRRAIVSNGNGFTEPSPASALEGQQ